ncbi:FecR domain-containing protein [Thalassospira sp. MA62]|nr:FecR domain-containing protein [Thalassospira sp. MA62]
MSGISDPIMKQAAKEATDWLILLQDVPDDAQVQAQFEAWCAERPVNLDAWLAISKTARVMAQIPPQSTELGTEQATGHRADWQVFLQNSRNQDVAGRQVWERQAAGSIAHSSANDNPDNGPLGEIAKAAALLESGHEITDRDGNVMDVRTRFERRGNRSWRGIGLGAAAVAASLVAAVIGPEIAIDLKADYTTETAEIRTVTLGDDSTVTLAPESAIRVFYDGPDRLIELLEGAAFFEVTPNKDRPFMVDASNLDVTVLGTGFEVMEETGATGVAVAHGLVRVEGNRADVHPSEELAAGEAASVYADGQWSRQSTPVDQVAAWRNNRLIAQDQPLGAVVDRLRRYYGGMIMVTDDDLTQQTVTGVYQLDDPQKALRAIARAQNATVREITPWMLIVSPS